MKRLNLKGSITMQYRYEMVERVGGAVQTLVCLRHTSTQKGGIKKCDTTLTMHCCSVSPAILGGGIKTPSKPTSGMRKQSIPIFVKD